MPCHTFSSRNYRPRMIYCARCSTNNRPTSSNHTSRARYCTQCSATVTRLLRMHTFCQPCRRQILRRQHLAIRRTFSNKALTSPATIPSHTQRLSCIRSDRLNYCRSIRAKATKKPLEYNHAPSSEAKQRKATVAVGAIIARVMC